ncbi:MAG TPA: HEAT repeat domain-containing protein [Leptospiraceae bacterium]|nr:HEAT repeat domain-containing protein [Leptospiraceae bacterium]
MCATTVFRFRVALIVFALAGACGPPRPIDLPENKEPPVPPLSEVMAGLKSAVWSERSEAVLAAGHGHYKETIPLLLSLLSSDPNPAVRSTAALVLADLGEQRAAAPIAQLLASSSEANAESLIEALARLKNPVGAYAVLPYLKSSSNQTRLVAVSALGEMNARSASGEILAMAMQNQDREVARTYAMVLGKLGAVQSESYLLSILRSSKDDPASAAAINALGSIKSVQAIPDLVKVMGSSYAKGRENAVPALIAIGSPLAIPGCFLLLENDSSEIRYAASEVIYSIPSPSTAPQALALLKKKSRSAGPASMILGHIHYKAARETIEQVLQDKSMSDRENIAKSLGWMGESASSTVLISVLKEKDGEGRYGAAWSLGVLRTPDGLGPLLEAADSGDRKLRQVAIEAIGSYGSSDSLPVLSKLLKDSVLSIYAVDAISNIKGEEARKLLTDHAKNQTGGTRTAAIMALGRRKEEASVPFLIQMLREDGTGEIQQSCMNALTEITGERFRTRGNWFDWFEKRQ